MLYAILIFLMAAVLYLLCRLHSLRDAVRKANQELKEISGQISENRIVKLSVPDQELESLLSAINENLKVIREEKKRCETKERQLREEVENISHDLRTPLTAVLGYLKMIDTEGMGGENQEYLEIALKKAKTLQNLVTQFYDLSRVSHEDFRLKLQDTDVVRVLRECCLSNYTLIEKANLQLQLQIPENPVWIWGNADAMERIFTNLIQNSVRYAKNQLFISLVIPPDEKQVFCVFRNDIQPESELPDPHRLFDRFYMQEEARTRGGTGLGLTISKHLIESMEGQISAEYSEEERKKYLEFRISMIRTSGR